MLNEDRHQSQQQQQRRQEEWSPFVGPRPFKRDAEEQKLFFGRKYESEKIISLIYSHKIVLVYAQSGAGKTSIFNASIVPALEERGLQVLPLTRAGIGSRDDTGAHHKTNTVTVESSSNETNPYVLNALQSLAPELQDSSLLNSKSLSEFLRDHFPHKINKRGKLIPQVIIFDQLEELFNLYSDPNKWREQQQDFFKQVADAVEVDPLLRVVLVIREDYLAQLDPFAAFLPERLKPRFRLERLNNDAAFEAVKGPLEKAKTYIDEKLIDKLFDVGVIDKLIEDLLKIRVETFGGKSREIKGEFVEPIQLQVVCQRLWNKLKTSQIDQITQEYFAYLGDVDKALEDFYVEGIREAAKQTGIEEGAIRNWFEENLITTTGTRGIVHRGFESTGGIANKAVDILEKKYLVRKEERSGAQWYELTHDRLIKPIKDSNEKWIHEQNYKQRINAIIDKGNSLHDVGKYDDAFQSYDKVLELDPNNTDALNAKALALERLGKQEEAIKCYDKVLELDPNNTDAWYYKGYVLFKMGQYDQAADHYNHAYNLDIHNESALLALRELYSNYTYQFEKSLKVSQKLLEIEPTLERRTMVAEDYIKTGKYKKGRQHAFQALKDTPAQRIKNQSIIRFLY